MSKPVEGKVVFITTGAAYASEPSFLDRVKVEADGTSTGLNAGLRHLAVRALSQAARAAPSRRGDRPVAPAGAP